MRRVTSGEQIGGRRKSGEGRSSRKGRKGERGVQEAWLAPTAHVRVSLKRRSREWRVETILDRSRASCRQISWRRVCLCHGSPARREEHGRREETEASLAAEAAYAATGRTGCAGQVASQFVVNRMRVFPLRE